MAEPTERPSPAARPLAPAATETGKPLPRPLPPTAADRPNDPTLYRPISGLAIAGFALAALYALLLIIITIAAFRQGSPVLLGSWSYLPVLSAFLCIIAWVRISRSEGTMAGQGLAWWGIVLSGLFGAAYWGWTLATYLAVSQQADAFAQQWLEKLREGKVSGAFLLSMDPKVRAGTNPDDEAQIEIRFNVTPENPMRGPLGAFRDSELVRTIRQAGSELKITPLGVSDWDYKNGYKVKRQYELDAPEGKYVAEIAAQSTDSRDREFAKRQWHVVWTESQLLPERTQVKDEGYRQEYLRFKSREFLNRWGDKLVGGQVDSAYLDTIEPARRGTVLRDEAVSRTAAGLAAGTASLPLPAVAALLVPVLDPIISRECYLAGFHHFTQEVLVLNDNKLRYDDVTNLRLLKSTMASVMRGNANLQGGRLFFTQVAGPMTKTPAGLYRYTHGGSLGFPPHHRSDLIGVVEGDGVIPENRKIEPSWRIVLLEPIGVVDASKERR